ncbi:MAG: hypothetical protein ABI833_15285 [Acidobacteriota bacterium]
MPPTKTKPRRDFDKALNAYLEAIQTKKATLLAAISQPCKETDKQYRAANGNEKEARHAYRKATKSLYAISRKA